MRRLSKANLGSLVMLALLALVVLIPTVRALVPARGLATAYGTNPDGVNTREDKTLAQVVTQAHGKYAEGVSRQQTFVASIQGTGIAPGTALGTTAFYSLYNPANSGVRVCIQKVRIGYVSGTLGAGVLYHCALATTTQTAPSGGTALTTYTLDVGSGAASKATAIAGATVVQPVAIGPICSTGAALATTALGFSQVVDDVDGEIWVEPGCTYQIQGVMAAGSTPLMTASVSWEEYPLL